MPYEFLMAGNIDNADKEIITKTIMSKTKLCGNAPFFLLFQSITIDAGQRPDEGRFPMVYMPCRADNNLFHSICNYTTFSDTTQ